MTRLPLLLALFAAPIAAADEKPKYNTLTPEEIAEGWILLFDGETTFGWKTDGRVVVQDGQLVLGVNEKAASAMTTAEFSNCQVRLEYLLSGKATLASAFIQQSLTGTLGNGWNKLEMLLDDDNVMKFHGGGKSIASVGKRPNQPEQRPGPVSFSVQDGSVLFLRSIKLKPLALQPLFNSKDLAGWKVFDDPKRKQSKWTVTKEGWLNVKDGPGDLQTEKKFDDFVLQLECMSNGDSLNSGLFFRCVENEYQTGYEMQIQNGYKDGDRTKPADFGTGAIYRRVPARKVVSNDKEWFTMTLVATGNHIATWVNGYQTVDWTDDRPADDNPRKGCRTAAGHLSIQGHDPTTDLSFRNIRAGALPAKK